MHRLLALVLQYRPRPLLSLGCIVRERAVCAGSFVRWWIALCAEAKLEYYVNGSSFGVCYDSTLPLSLRFPCNPFRCAPLSSPLCCACWLCRPAQPPYLPGLVPVLLLLFACRLHRFSRPVLFVLVLGVFVRSRRRPQQAAASGLGLVEQRHVPDAPR